jgi:hypothetical protein
MHIKGEAKWLHDASFEAFMAVMFQIEFFWVVTPCSVVAATLQGVTTQKNSI